MNPKAYRLPGHALPERYDIRLDARIEARDYHGDVTIRLELVEPRDVIELHARDIALSAVTLDANGRTFAGHADIDPERELAMLRFDEPLPVGPATLRIAFAGQVSQGLEGLYLAADGAERLLCTQCESTDARSIFPCFDEPTFKARFAFEITTAADATVLANSALIETRAAQDGASRTWVFAPTERMSTYLIAFVIGDIASGPEEVLDGVPLRVWAMRGKQRMGTFALDFTKQLQPWYTDYFGVPYHFGKYDQVAVPGFAAGAMENSGLVLFRQSALLMDPQTAAWESEKGIAHVVAHEFAHMWFGNLVTMRWWDDLWLNEAFAEWVSIKAVDELAPDYMMWDDFLRSKRAALTTDALENTHPIYSPVETPADALEMFDHITYLKGCSVLRMLENFLGDTAFRAGIRSYMREFGERNAVGADLWRNLEQATNEPVAAIMESWITQGGYPLVTVAIEGDGAATMLRVSQARFFASPDVPADDTSRWQVPLVIRYADAAGTHKQQFLLREREAALPLPVQGTLGWCYANADEIGFYRQQFGGDLLERVLANLDQLSTAEQMGLLGDQWALTRQGSQSMARFLDVLTAMSRSDTYHVVGEVVGIMHTLKDLLEDAGDAQALVRFRAWVADAFADRMAALGWEPQAGESRNTAQQRVALVDAMAMLAEDPVALSAAQVWAAREAEDPAAVDPNLAAIFIDATAAAGDDDVYERFLEVYQERREAQSTPQERDRYLYSLLEFKPLELVQRTVDLMDRRVLPQESAGLLLRSMLGRRHAQRVAWDYVKSHWEAIQQIGSFLTPPLVEASGRLPVDLRDDLVAFYDSHLNGAAQKSYARALEAMDQAAEFKARTRVDLIGWFMRE